jgi:hypothetical protein
MRRSARRSRRRFSEWPAPPVTVAAFERYDTGSFPSTAEVDDPNAATAAEGDLS